MNLTTTLSALVIVAIISAGQVLFKLSSSSMPTAETLTPTRMIAFLLDPYFLAAIVTYAVGTLLWTSVLRSADLSRAYPVMALSFAIVPAIGILFFGEKASIGLGMGIALILTGVVVIARFA